MRRIFTYLIFMLLPVLAMAQERLVTGKVISSEDNLPLPGVSVIVQGTTKGTATDMDGNYSISLAPGENVLVFSFVGFTTQTITVGDRTTIDLTLPADTKTLEEVVVVGYGVTRKSDLTGAVSSIKGEEIAKVPALNPLQGLQGKVAGVQITNVSGAPGTAPIVRIRGTGTFNNASPIYVVDGVILNDITFLNSGDIQSMEVLKDASATAIYGSRGANGVIMITTKRGTKGQEGISVNVTGEYSIQNQQKRIDLLNGPQFATIANEITPGSYNNVNAVPSTNWQDQVFRQAAIQNYQISLTGSSQKSQYYFGLGYFKQDGVIPKSSYERLSARFNGTYNVSKNVRLGNNLTVTPYQQQNTYADAPFTAYRAWPTVTPYQTDGSYSPVQGVGNVLAAINYTNDHPKGLRMVGNIFGEVDFLKGFTLRSSFGADISSDKTRTFTPQFFVSPQQQTSYSELVKTWNDSQSWLWENTLAYKKQLGKSRVDAVAGVTMQNVTSEKLSLDARNLSRDGKDFWYVNGNNLYAQQTTNSVDPDQFYSMMSYLGRVNYTFDDRYLFTATFRRDGSSKFNQANRFANFPSFALGWNVINEGFMDQFSNWLSNLKVRGSWGIIGNEKINYQKRFSVVDNGDNAVFGTGETLYPGQSYGALGNPNLRWESTHQTDVGLEAGFLNDRLTAEFDYYHRDTKDILIDLQVPAYLGNNGQPITYNAGEVLNRGFEMTLRWTGEIKDFTYSISANGTTIHNEALKVMGVGGPGDYLLGSANGLVVTRTYPGAPIGSFYGYQAIGVFQNAAQLASTPHLAAAGVGDLIFADTDNNGILDDRDRTNLGSPIPKLLYGMNLQGGYKGFDLSIDLQGVAGNKIYNGKETIRPDLYNFESHVWNRWTGDGTSNTEPRASSGGYNFLPSSRFVQSGSYFRLRNVTLGYNLSKDIAQKLNMTNLRVYVRGTNIFTASKFTGYSPEVASSSPIANGIDNGTYPIPAIYSAGVNVTF